ncbi:MAG TPA: universal stress protein [Acidimicrobiales bacterium]|nr:universal stress protein [Acidimicrobiales bacterium]
MTTVVIALDGSKYAERALGVGGWLAGRLGGDVELVSAVDEEAQRAEREHYLASVVPSLVGAHRVGTAVVVDRDPAGVIHESVRRAGDAVACLATHGRGASAALVGSVATDVVARGRDPVVLVGPLVSEDRSGAGVVTCADERPESVALVRLAAGWGDRLAEPVVVVVVAEPVPPPLDDRPARRLFGPDGDASAFVATLIEAAECDGVTGEVVWDPISPADGLITYLDEHPAALVVIASRARKALEHAVFGHTDAAAVHSSPSPVLVVPRDGLA